MTDKIDTSTLGRIDLASGKSPPPIEECVSTWAVDDLVDRLRRHEPRTTYLATCRTAPVIKNEYEAPTNPDGPEAADRIQSLIADRAKDAAMIEMMKEAMVKDLAEKLTLIAENERLKEALQQQVTTPLSTKES